MLLLLLFNEHLHRGTDPLQAPLVWQSSAAGPFSRYPHEHLNTALPQADVFNSVKVRWGSSRKSDGHCTGLHTGGGDDQFPISHFGERVTHNINETLYVLFNDGSAPGDSFWMRDAHFWRANDPVYSYLMPNRLRLGHLQWYSQLDRNIWHVDPISDLRAAVLGVLWAPLAESTLTLGRMDDGNVMNEILCYLYEGMQRQSTQNNRTPSVNAHKYTLWNLIKIFAFMSGKQNRARATQ